MHLVFEPIASMNGEEMKKIGDKSSILSPITGFQTQNPFRKPSDSSPQDPVTTSNNSWTKASLRWRGSIKTGSIGLRSEWLDWVGNLGAERHKRRWI